MREKWIGGIIVVFGGINDKNRGINSNFGGIMTEVGGINFKVLYKVAKKWMTFLEGTEKPLVFHRPLKQH